MACFWSPVLNTAQAAFGDGWGILGGSFRAGGARVLRWEEATGPDGEGQGAICDDLPSLGLSGEDWERAGGECGELLLAGGTSL